MSWVQYIFEGLKGIVPRRQSTTYGLRFVWQMTPVTIIGIIYYSNMEFMEENDSYLMRLYDLKAVEIVKESSEAIK